MGSLQLTFNLPRAAAQSQLGKGDAVIVGRERLGVHFISHAGDHEAHFASAYRLDHALGPCNCLTETILVIGGW